MNEWCCASACHPAIQSLVDYTGDSTHGSAFGRLQLTGNMGSLIGGLFLIMVASTTFQFHGWKRQAALIQASVERHEGLGDRS
uniref:Uncharacterized protein n=1 Tax=Arundo donax TaxID=35708 RepID=A0A0A9FFR0_ARUDO